ncbi:MAG TPA: VOC family protein [Iamia sp.]|jgi:predicted lactoylglutathione lyase|nr:VOC family protein [Iamia sp.]
MSRPFVIALPVEDRVRSHAFYTEGLGLEAVGPLADDGVPEPLQLRLGPDLHLMLIPRGGFGWVTAPHETAAAGTSECQLSWRVSTEAEVDAAVGRARAAGADVLVEPEVRPWGYSALFADPDAHLWMVMVPPADWCA